MMNDKFYGQWLVLHRPFRHLEDFKRRAQHLVDVFPQRYHIFALAWHIAPDFWHDESKIRSEMELEAHGEAFIHTILNKARAIDAPCSGTSPAKWTRMRRCHRRTKETAAASAKTDPSSPR